jgi:hypothetical protein
MSDDEGHVDPKAMSDSAIFGEALLYDFAKFLTTRPASSASAPAGS